MDPQIELIGASPEMAAVLEKIERLVPRQSGARRLAPVLLQGETGTGKGLIARLIHRTGPRGGGPFVDVNCAAIPENLLEAEMFGFERGAFTDARQAKPGLFQVAHGGTIFLDEIGLLPEPLQAKLLKVIEERAVRRLGATRSEDVDVWIVAATNEDLAAATRSRRFRADLYHRLAVVTLALPPLRERGTDVLLLAEHFLARACADYGLSPKRLTPEARQALLGYPWPGNIRELSNVIERVALLWEAPLVTVEMLGLPATPPRIAPGPARGAGTAAPETPASGDERERLLAALGETGWNVSRAAARLGISRNTIRYRIEKHRLRRGLDDAPAPPVPVAPAAARPPVAERVEAGAPSLVRWERRRITFLKAAVVVEEPGAFQPDLSRVFEVLVDKARSFGGQIEELSRAALVAVFGLDPSEDAPRRAANAALAITKGVERARRAEGGLEWRLGLAVHVAEVLVGRVDGSTQIDHEAKRDLWPALDALLARAPGNAIVVSDAAAAFLERHFDLVAVGDPPARVHRLAGRERSGPGGGAGIAKFVGRRQELNLLRSRFESALRGQGQLVGITGEAGIGKSRLLDELRKSLADEPVTYLEGHCLSYGGAISYMPVLEMLRASCKILESDSPAVVAEKVRVALAELAIGPMEGVPYLLHLLGIKEDAEWVAELDTQTIQARIFETLRQVSVLGSRLRPLILVVEDLQWIDSMSEEYFASLADILAGARVLFLTTYRSGYRPRWMEKSYATQISLQPLAPSDSLDVVRSVLGTGPTTESAVEVIVAKGEGNPFFLEELSRTVREQGGLSAQATVPDTVQEVLLARIDRLPPEQKHLLQAASVVGKNVAVALLRSVAELPDDVLTRGLLGLRTAEFLYETHGGPDVEYTFRHALTQEVAYASLLEDRRRALHVRIVDALERLSPERRGEQVERLAEHAVRGELWEKAATYLRQAGVRDAARSAHREAVARYEQALRALERLPRTRERIEQAIDLRFDLRTSLLPLGQLPKILAYLREAETLALTISDQRRLGQLCAYITNYYFVTGQQKEALEFGERAHAIATALGDFALAVETKFRLGQVHHAVGQYRRAVTAFGESVESVQGPLRHERFGLPVAVSVVARSWLARSCAALGEFARGIASGEEALQIAQAVDQPFDLVIASQGAGHVYLRKGDLARAIPVLEQGLELCRVWKIPVWFPQIASALGSAYALSGRFADGLPLLEEAVAQHAAMRRVEGHALWVAGLSEGYLRAGRLEDAAGFARQALDLAVAHRERGHEAWILRLLGEIALDAGEARLVEGEELYRRGLALADELAMRPLVAHCRLGLGRLARRRGDRAGAEPHLAAAVALLGEMEMGLWLGPAEAELRAL